MKIKLPDDLSPAAKKLYVSIAEEIELDAAGAVMLGTICQQFDRVKQARRLLRREGLVLKDRFGMPKLHPAQAVERDAITALTRAWRALGLDLAPPVGS
jgi:phage terminase small subunit